MKLLFLGTSVVVLGLAFQQSTHPMVKKHVDTLQAGHSLKLVLSVGEVGGVMEEQTLTVSKGGHLRWESPTTLTVADGKVVYRLNKVKKEYTETPQKENWKNLLQEDVPWIWSALENAEFAKSVNGATSGSSRKMRNVAVVEVKATGVDKRPVTLYFDEAAGMFRGASYEIDHGSSKVTLVVFATEVNLSEKPLDEGLFAFDPKGAQKQEAPVAGSVTFAEVKGIFDANCKGCHGPGGKAGLDVTSYETISSGRRPNYIAGDAENSRLYKSVATGKMPPGRKLAAGDIQKIGDWINQGAVK